MPRASVAAGRAAAEGGGGKPEDRSQGRSTAILSVSIGTAGAIAYAYFAFASHALPPTEYGRITLLWSAVFITVSVLYRPIEQLLSRTIADRDARGRQGREHLRVAGTIQVALGAAFVVTALALRGPLETKLFEGSRALYWVLVVAVVAYAASYFARGFLAGREADWLLRWAPTSWSRRRGSHFPIVVVVGVASGQSVVALGVAAAPILSLAVLPFANAAGRRFSSRARRSHPARATGEPLRRCHVVRSSAS